MDIFRELNELADYRDGYRAYWETIKAQKMPAVPFLIPYFHDLLFILENSPTSIGEGDLESSLVRTNMVKFYDMFSIAAELETFRLTSYHSKMILENDNISILLQHIRHVSKQDDVSVGLPVVFSSGFVPEENVSLSGQTGTKAIKKIVQFLSERSQA